MNKRGKVRDRIGKQYYNNLRDVYINEESKETANENIIELQFSNGL